VYRRSADKIINGVKEHFPGIETEVNLSKPRSKSFEVNISL